MSEWPMRGHFRYLRFKNFPMTPRTLQCEVFWALLLSSKHSGVPEDSKSLTFPSVGLHPHTWPKWGCDIRIGQTLENCNLLNCPLVLNLGTIPKTEDDVIVVTTLFWCSWKINARMMRKQFLWFGPRVVLLNYAYFHCWCILFFIQLWVYFLDHILSLQVLGPRKDF
jgi:hypothetical protein